jgi:hypothetical protein
MKAVLPIRRLNDHGIEAMEDFLDSFKTGEARPLSEIDSILEGTDTTIYTPKLARVDRSLTFERRFDLAEYLHPIIPALGLQDPTRDKGLWAWLALAWFEQFAFDKKGVVTVGEYARWVPVIGSGWRYYRHFVLGPSMVYTAHQDAPQRALALLSEPLSVSTSEIYRLFVESPLPGCRPAVEAAHSLYWDAGKQCLRRGVGLKGAGGSRRLLNVFMQFDRTFDLHSIDPAFLYSMLPQEFDRFKPKTDKTARQKWSEDELILALELYYRIEFGQLHQKNSDIIRLADLIGRTPGAIAMKCCNFASLDPVQKSRGVVGLSGASKLDRELFSRFENDRDSIKIACVQSRKRLFNSR